MCGITVRFNYPIKYLSFIFLLTFYRLCLRFSCVFVLKQSLSSTSWVSDILSPDFYIDDVTFSHILTLSGCPVRPRTALTWLHSSTSPLDGSESHTLEFITTTNWLLRLFSSVWFPVWTKMFFIVQFLTQLHVCFCFVFCLQQYSRSKCYQLMQLNDQSVTLKDLVFTKFLFFS